MSAINPTFTDRYRDAVVDLISGSITASSLNLSGNLFVAGDTEIQGNAIIDDIVSLSGKVRWDNGTSDGLSGTSSIAIGTDAGKTTQGINSVAIGKESGMTSQAVGSGNAIAIGTASGKSNQGNSGIAIGNGAGGSYQGSNAVAIGYQSGSDSQAYNTVAIGYTSGKLSQGGQAIAIGSGAGTTSQSSNAIAIGPNSGHTSQGTSSIAIGKQAGETSQHANSIVLNASGSALNTDGTSRFFVNPIRSSSTSVTYPLYYTPSTSEVTYAPITTAVSLTGTTGDYYEIAIPTDCTRMVISGLDVVHTGSTYGKFEFGDATQWYGSGSPAYYIGQFSHVRSDLGIQRDLWSSFSGVPINIILTSSPLTFSHRFEYMGYDGTTYYNWICSSESYYFTSFYNTGNSCGYARTPVKPTRIRLALTGGSGDYTGGLLRVLFF